MAKVIFHLPNKGQNPSPTNPNPNAPTAFALEDASEEDKRVIMAIYKAKPSWCEQRTSLPSNYPFSTSSVMVLWSAGFEWEAEALQRALNILAEEVQKK